jgi:uncharacterized protein YutE (UPF0331/DUF86 family)
MSVDRLLVTRKFALVLGDLTDIERLARLDRSQFLADRTNQLVAERLLERVIGRMIDVNYHIITERAGLPPKDFHESFTKLAHLGVLPSDLAHGLAPAAGLRNRLAHEYNEIDYRKIYDALSDIGGRVTEYIAAIEAFLASGAEAAGEQGT